MSFIQIAIDGPAGAGKSTIARILAEKLGFLYIDSGAMYRTVTWAALEKGAACEDEEELSRLAARIDIDLVKAPNGGQLVICNGRDVTAEIRGPKVTEKVSLVSQYPGVRSAMVAKQKSLAHKRDVVMDGRDIGTVVLPAAGLKIFLTASLEERAKRRRQEYLEKGFAQDYEKIRQDLLRRDILDENREVGPLRAAADAVVVDTTMLKIDDVVSLIMRLYDEKKG